MSDEVQAVLAAEAMRRDLMVARDFDSLRALLHPELSYVHLDGRRQDRADYLAHVERDFRTVGIRWEQARVRVAGNCALIDGTIINSLVPASDPDGPARHFPAAALLAWSRSDRWRLIAYQGTRDATLTTDPSTEQQT